MSDEQQQSAHDYNTAPVDEKATYTAFIDCLVDYLKAGFTHKNIDKDNLEL